MNVLPEPHRAYKPTQIGGSALLSNEVSARAMICVRVRCTSGERWCAGCETRWGIVKKLGLGLKGSGSTGYLDTARVRQKWRAGGGGGRAERAYLEAKSIGAVRVVVETLDGPC